MLEKLWLHGALGFLLVQESHLCLCARAETATAECSLDNGMWEGSSDVKEAGERLVFPFCPGSVPDSHQRDPTAAAAQAPLPLAA